MNFSGNSDRKLVEGVLFELGTGENEKTEDQQLGKGKVRHNIHSEKGRTLISSQSTVGKMHTDSCPNPLPKPIP